MWLGRDQTQQPTQMRRPPAILTEHPDQPGRSILSSLASNPVELDVAWELPQPASATQASAVAVDGMSLGNAPTSAVNGRGGGGHRCRTSGVVCRVKCLGDRGIEWDGLWTSLCWVETALEAIVAAAVESMSCPSMRSVGEPEETVTLRGVLGAAAPLGDRRVDACLCEQVRETIAQFSVAGAAVEVEQFDLHVPSIMRALAGG